MKDIIVIDQPVVERKKGKEPTHNAKIVKPSQGGAINKKFECSMCHMAFKHRGVYNRHLITHSKEKPHVCEVCGKGFSRKHHLINHRKVHMSSEERAKLKKYPCEECGKMFTRKEYLNQHSHSTEKDKVHDCPCCSKSFVQRSGLVRHMACHQSKKIRCDICDKYFYRLDVLRQHRETHNSQKNETCEQCGKSFNSKTYLKKHLRSHSQKGKYSCTVCYKEFVRKSDLNRHRDNYSKIPLQDSNHCGKPPSPKDSIEHYTICSCLRNPANKKMEACHCLKQCDSKRDTSVDKVNSCKVIILDDSCEVFISDNYPAESSSYAIEEKFSSVQVNTVNGKNTHSRTCNFSARVPFVFFGFDLKCT
ncbi:zinc finger protein OZF-like [Macrobrachium nipponense]|uniref:zinc finger protein OZF-like n=1 Tax=Macrobrachium nipponense TaxID=159736 RepID=UPI0030C8021A